MTVFDKACVIISIVCYFITHQLLDYIAGGFAIQVQCQSCTCGVRTGVQVNRNNSIVIES